MSSLLTPTGSCLIVPYKVPGQDSTGHMSGYMHLCPSGLSPPHPRANGTLPGCGGQRFPKGTLGYNAEHETPDLQWGRANSLEPDPRTSVQGPPGEGCPHRDLVRIMHCLRTHMRGFLAQFSSQIYFYSSAARLGPRHYSQIPEH